MTFKNRAVKTVTAAFVLVSFGWMAGGGQALAEARSARRDPARALLRLADNPRLALAPPEKAQFRKAAQQLLAAPAAAPVRPGPARPVREPGAEMQALAAELDGITDPDRLAEAEQRLRTVHRKVLADFAETGKLLLSAGLPQAIQDRREAARTAYLQEAAALFRDLESARTSPSLAAARPALRSAVERLRRSSTEAPSQEFDPEDLPFRNAKRTTRDPGTSAGLRNAVAPLGATASRTAPAPADLAANEEVQITPEIQALAASLDNQPLRIYGWVRGNIEFVPTHGSVQGSQMTLETKRGNAFDTASLLIALLRAAGVPARYVTGTVAVPVDAMRNWVGGAAGPNVAQAILGQGGIPNVGLIRGGATTHIRIEHVWVEAWVDHVPSRGAVHVAGDTWLPMDASFKLHSFTPGSRFFQDVPFNVVQPEDHLFDVDDAGRITHFEDEVLDERLAVWATQADEYIRRHGIRTPEDLLGAQKIVPETSGVFPGSLPYEVITRAEAVDTLPAGLRHSVTLHGYASSVDRSEGRPAFSVQVSLPALNSRRLGLQFEPATETDAEILAAARSGGADSLPVYLVDVVPAVKLDGAVLGTGAPVGMGSRYLLDLVLQSPEGPATVSYRVTAGDEIVVGVTGNGLTQEVIEKRFAAHLVDNAPEYLHQVQLHYWMQCDYFGRIAAKTRGVHLLRLPSVGLFSSPLQVDLLFGAPRTGVYQSRTMDIRRSLLGTAASDPAKVIDFMKQAGLQSSYLEGAVFNQLENHPEPAIRGFSAVHLLSAAASQNIPIYRITSVNAAAVLPSLDLHSGVKSDIQTAVSQGKSVLVSEREVDLGVWSGVGYIIQDETTGGGAYLISGGLNGGGMIDCVRELVPVLQKILLIILASVLLAMLLTLLLGALAGLAGTLVAGAGVKAGAAAAFLFLAMFAKSSTSMDQPPATTA